MSSKASGGRQDRPPTMKDVARIAGVSAITVSRALGGSPNVSTDVRDRVLSAARDLHYVPNVAAGTLRSRRSRIVCVIVPTISHSIFAETIQAMSGIFRPAGYHLLIGHSGYSLDEEEALVSAFLARKPDAIILTGYTHSPATIEMIHRAEIPLVEIWNVTDRPRDTMVGIDNEAASYAMTSLLLRKGYRKIGYIGGLRDSNDRVEQREAGFLAALREAGTSFSPSAMVRRPLEFEHGSAALSQLLAQAPETDAVFAASDILAIGVLLECAHQGIAVPKRLGVAGFDDMGLASRMNPTLTTVRVPREEIGRRAAQEILARLAGAPSSPKVIDLGYEIIERRST